MGYGGIAFGIGLSTVLMVALVGLFLYDSAWVIVPIVGFMTLLGIVLGYFAHKSS